MAGAGTLINQTLTNPSNASAGTVEYIVTPTSTTGTCAGAATTITVTVNPIPLVTTASTKTICSGAGSNISLTASAASNFSWTIGTITGGVTGATVSSGSTINQTLTNPSTTNAGSVEYLVTPTSTGGTCAGSAYTITVAVNPTPAVTNASTKTICSGTSTAISLTAGVASSFTWTIGAITNGITGASASSGSTINQTLTNPGNSVAGTVQYQVTPTSTGGSCTGAAFTITVTVNPIPALTNGATASTCSGISPNISLTATAASSFSWTIGTITGGITGASASSGSSINQILIDPSNTVDGTVQYLVTPTSLSNSCVGAVSTITVTVIHAPLVTNTASASTCSGTGPNIALTANEASTFTWAIGSVTGGITGASASSGATINQTLTNPSNSSIGTVQYLVTPTSNAGSCVGPVHTITVTVNPLPLLTNAAAVYTCSGSSPNTTLTSSVASTYSWTIGAITGGITGASASSGNAINQTLTNPSTANAGTVEYLVTPTSTTGLCVGPVDTITATVNVAPIAIFTGGTNQTVCSGVAIPTAITLGTSNSIVGTTYTWTRNDTTNVTGTTSGSGNITGLVLTNATGLARTVTFTIIPTGPAPTFCIGAAITTTMVVNPLPVFNSGLAPTGICSGATFAYTATSTIPGSTFTWSRAAVTNISPATNSGTGDISEPLTNSTTSPISVTYVYQVSANSCTNPTLYNVIVPVNVFPSLSSTLTPTAICSGSAFSYIPASATPNTSFAWTRPAITGISNVTNSGTGNPGEILNDTLFVSVNVKYIYALTAEGCTNPLKDTVVVTVKPKALLSSSLTPPAICSGSIFSYPPASLTAGTTFAWSRAVVTNISNIAASGVDNPGETLSNTSAEPVTVTYVYTTTASSCSYTQNVLVVVNPIPVLTSTLLPSAICSGTAFSYNPLSSTSGAAFAWTRAGIIGISNTPGSGNGNPNEILINTTGSTVIVRYIYTVSANGCTNPATYNVDVPVSLVPALSSSLSLTAICSGTTVSYTPTSGTSGTTFSWTRAAIIGISNIAGSGTDNPNEPLINTTSATINVEYVYTLTANGCTNPTTYTVVVPVNPTPTLTSSLNPPAVCSGSSFNYTVVSPTSGAAATWTRAVVPGITNIASSGTGDISEVLTNTTSLPVGVTYEYTVSANGCTSTFYVNVTVNPIPVLTSTLAPAATCSGVIFSYNPQSSTLGAMYTWTRAAIAGISNPSASGTSSPNEILIDTTVNPVNNVTYIYSVSANGCINPGTYNVVVTVNPTPGFTSSLTPPAICSGNPFAYTPASATSGTAFAWTRSPVTGISNIGSSGTDNPNEVLVNTTADSVKVTYVYTLTANGCTNPTSYSVVVTVNPTPSLSSTLFPSAICSGSTFSYIPQSLTAGAVFTWSRTAVSGINNVSASGTGNPNEILIDTTVAQKNVTYVYTIAAKGCSTTNNVVVTVNPIPLLTSTLTPAAICSGSSFSYNPQSSTVSSAFTWSRAAVSGISNIAGSGTDSPNEILTNTSSSPVSVTYIYTVSANGCTNASAYSVVVSVNPVPGFTSSLTPPSMCSGTSFAYVPTSNTLGAAFSWTRAAVNGISNIAGSGTNNPNEVLYNTTINAVNVTYVYTVSINGCSNPVVNNVVVSVKPTPTLTSTPSPNAICSGAVFRYIPTSQLTGVTFTWTRAAVPGLSNISGSGTDSIHETLVLSDTIPVNVTYIFTLSNGTCTNGITFSVVLTVNKPCLCSHPFTSNLKPPSICTSTAFSYTPTSSTAGATFAWTRAQVTGISNLAGSGPGNPNETLINTITAPVDVTYVYTVSANGCANPVTFNVVVTVNPKPLMTSSLTPPSICSGSSFMYVPSSGTSGATFAWTRAAVAGISNIAAAAADEINETLTNTSMLPVNVIYVYTVSANNCTNASSYSVTVPVNPSPTLSSTTTPAAICSGSTLSYIPTSATTGASFIWTRLPVSGIGEPPISGTGNLNEVLTNLTTFPLFVTYQYTILANGCQYQQNVFVTVNPRPTLISSVSPAAICSGTVFGYIPSSETPGASFNWTRPAVTNISNPAASGLSNPNETLTNTSAAPIDVTYQYTVSANGCTSVNSYAVVVTVNPRPLLTSSVAATTICSGTNFSYVPTSLTAGASFTWTRVSVTGISNPSDSGTANPNETLVDTIATPVNVTYDYTVSANGCADTTVYSIVVTVDPSYLVVNAGVDISVELGGSVTLHATGATTYSWTPVTGLDNPNSADPVLTPELTTTYILTGKDGNGCVDTDSLMVTVITDHNLIISNVMTPNGDGKNDTWIIVNIESYPNTDITVVNNQGQEVYKSSAYDNSWNGTFNGKKLPDGTYYYFLKFAAEDKVYSGSITIFND